MSTETHHEDPRSARPDLPQPRGGLSEADGELDGFGLVIGSDEEHEAFLSWLSRARRTGQY